MDLIHGVSRVMFYTIRGGVWDLFRKGYNWQCWVDTVFNNFSLIMYSTIYRS